MTAPAYVPTSRLVAEAWVRAAIAGPEVGQKLPQISDQLRADGFIRVPTVGGSADRDVPVYQSPVVTAECWWPPPKRGEFSHWHRAEQLAQRLVLATDDPELMGLDIDLSAVGDFAPARVHDVIALTLPDAVEEDPNDWARYDIDLLINWTGV